MAPQPWNASDYETNDRFVPDLGAPLLRLLDPADDIRLRFVARRPLADPQ